MEQDNTYITEIKKFEGKEVKVTTMDGQEFNGLCKAMYYNYGHVILMTETEKIIVRNVKTISRARSYKGK